MTAIAKDLAQWAESADVVYIDVSGSMLPRLGDGVLGNFAHERTTYGKPTLTFSSTLRTLKAGDALLSHNSGAGTDFQLVWEDINERYKKSGVDSLSFLVISDEAIAQDWVKGLSLNPNANVVAFNVETGETIKFVATDASCLTGDVGAKMAQASRLAASRHAMRQVLDHVSEDVEMGPKVTTEDVMAPRERDEDRLLRFAHALLDFKHEPGHAVLEEARKVVRQEEERGKWDRFVAAKQAIRDLKAIKNGKWDGWFHLALTSDGLDDAFCKETEEAYKALKLLVAALAPEGEAK